MFPMNRMLRDLLMPTVVLLALASPTGVHAQQKKGSQFAAVAPAAHRVATRFTTQDPPSALIPPYPPSDFIECLTVDARRFSIGDGDNWANTWGDDDRMYSFFTDGRGFDRKKRVSCAPVIIEGHPPQISGRDLVSPTGTIPDPSGKKSSKVSGLLMVDGVLYAWVRNLNLPGAPKGTGAGMMVSTDRGLSWEWVDWNWPELGYPVWVNAGRNYEAARDDYAYYLSPDGPSAYADYPHLVLGRVPVASIRDQAAHEFFAGFASPGVPRWGRFESRKPVFTDPNGCFRPNLVYNPGLKRYFLVMSSPYGKWKWWATDNPNRRAHLGIFDAPTPWGPWSVVYYIADWGAPENRFAPNIPSKWISDDGTTFYLLYSCIPNGPYQFNVQRCTVKLKGP